MSIQNQDSAVEVQIKSAPTTGQTVAVTCTQPVTTVIVPPSGTLANLTITLAAGNIDGQRCTMIVTQIITAFTSPGNATYLALPTSLTAGQKITFVYSLGGGVWYYIGA